MTASEPKTWLVATVIITTALVRAAAVAASMNPRSDMLR